MPLSSPEDAGSQQGWGNTMDKANGDNRMDKANAKQPWPWKRGEGQGKEGRWKDSAAGPW